MYIKRMLRMFRRTAASAALAAAASAMSPLGGVFAEEAEPGLVFDAGASLRVRQEIIRNVPAAVNGMLGRPGQTRGKTRNHFRFRPSVWMQLSDAEETWRIYVRVTDEFRAGIASNAHKQRTFPCEAVLDNLFIETKGLFGGFLDIKAGRQDIYRLYGLDHIFADGTPGDGSCSVHSDMIRAALNFSETDTLDLFALYNADRDELRWGTKRSRSLSKTGFGVGKAEMDDWGFGAVWSSRAGFADWQLFYIGKGTKAFHNKGVKHPRRFTNLFGTKIVPHWTENFSTPVEAMAQVGKNGNGNALHAWAGYAGFDWRAAGEGVRPFVSGGVLVLSGDEKAADEDGGRGAWDPMWYRGVDDGEMFLYGSLYGCGWWSNLVNVKTSLGAEFGYRHSATVSFGPMFAEERDGLGGGDSLYKGFFTQMRYEFPLYISPKEEGGRFELFGHVLCEIFNPGDYYITDKPAVFFRWQVEARF